MVFAFFRKPDGAMDQIETRAIGMVNDARHSFDLATLALLGGTNIDAVADDVRATDARINQAEQDIRSELIVHVSVQGTQDIGLAMGYTLLTKKIERIGDQAKNILELAEEGVNLADGDDADELMLERQTVSSLFAETTELLVESTDEQIADFADRIGAIMAQQQEKILELTHADTPAHHAVPRAIYYRYLKRIVANLRGVVSTSSEPLEPVDSSGTVIDDPED